jgi:hypothetical protein
MYILLHNIHDRPLFFYVNLCVGNDEFGLLYLFSRLLFSRFWVGFFVLNGTLAIFRLSFFVKGR